MADLPYIQQAQEVKITGQDTTGNTVYYVGADANGNMLVKCYSSGSVAAGTAATVSELVGAVYNTTLPTLTTGQQASLQFDANARLITRLLTSTDVVSAVQSGTWNITNISGTISLPTGASTAANQTTEITSLQLIDNPVGGGSGGAGGTAGTNSFLIGGVYNSTLPTLTTAQQAGIQLDINGRVIIAPLTNASIVKAQLQDNAGTGLTSTLIGTKQRLDVDTAFSGADNATAPTYTAQIGGTDSTGKLQAAKAAGSGELFVNDVLDVGSQYKALSVSTTAVLAIGGTTALANRKVITITPTNGKIYWGTSSAVTTTTGQPIFANQTLTLRASANITVYLIGTATTDVRVFEGS